MLFIEGLVEVCERDLLLLFAENFIEKINTIISFVHFNPFASGKMYQQFCMLLVWIHSVSSIFTISSSPLWNHDFYWQKVNYFIVPDHWPVLPRIVQCTALLHRLWSLSKVHNFYFFFGLLVSTSLVSKGVNNVYFV